MKSLNDIRKIMKEYEKFLASKLYNYFSKPFLAFPLSLNNKKNIFFNLKNSSLTKKLFFFRKEKSVFSKFNEVFENFFSIFFF